MARGVTTGAGGESAIVEHSRGVARLANRSTPGGEENRTGVVRRRELLIPISAPGASQERLSAYLALVERPLTALLARERLRPEGPGRWTYRSNPHRVLHLEVVPTLALAARWEEGRLRVGSTGCRLAGLGSWGERLGFRLKATLEPARDAVAGWAEVGLDSPLLNTPGARGLAGLALEHVLDRMERRLSRGFLRDAAAWLREDGSDQGRGG